MCRPLSRLHGLSAAEDFFAVLGIAFEPKVLDVHRLHILKRFNELLDPRSLNGVGEDAAMERARVALSTAYMEYEAGIGPKTFKVFREAHAGFVPLSALG